MRNDPISNLTNYIIKQFPNYFMVSVPTFKSSSAQDIDFVHLGLKRR